LTLDIAGSSAAATRASGELARQGSAPGAERARDSLRNEHLELIVPKNGTVSLRPRYFTRSS